MKEIIFPSSIYCSINLIKDLHRNPMQAYLLIWMMVWSKPNILKNLIFPSFSKHFDWNKTTFFKYLGIWIILKVDKQYTNLSNENVTELQVPMKKSGLGFLQGDYFCQLGLQFLLWTLCFTKLFEGRLLQFA